METNLIHTSTSILHLTYSSHHTLITTRGMKESMYHKNYKVCTGIIKSINQKHYPGLTQTGRQATNSDNFPIMLHTMLNGETYWQHDYVFSLILMCSSNAICPSRHLIQWSFYEKTALSNFLTNGCFTTASANFDTVADITIWQQDKKGLGKPCTIHGSIHTKHTKHYSY